MSLGLEEWIRINGRGISGSEKNINKSMKETNVRSSRKASLVEQRVCIEREGNELKRLGWILKVFTTRTKIYKYVW